MCGIFGGISIKESSTTLQRMDAILFHRGPDDSGVYIKDGIALGHRRLSIIDLPGGHQPMFSHDRNQIIVYNGEIYNFKEIKKLLIQKGHVFRTKSDTEVIINAYREWGYDCLDKFNGMFAFALWDHGTDKLWLVRDRIGVKPLYFLEKCGAFYFASEAKALWKLSNYDFEYDFTAIDQYLTYRYVPKERTFFKGITKLPPGHWMIVDKNGKICKDKKWWDIPGNRTVIGTDSNFTMEDCYNEFHSIFSSAVQMRMISDVPLGLFLSSGIDSASIALEMVKTSDLTGFTIGFGDATDELKTACMLAKNLKAKHIAFLMEEKDFELFPEAVACMDEPYGDSIILPTYLLAKKSAEKVKVILTGDGADETIGGYIHHNYFAKLQGNIPSCLFKAFSIFLMTLPSYTLNFLFNYPAPAGKAGKGRLKTLLKSYPDILKSYLSFASLFTTYDKQSLYSDDFKQSLEKEPDELSIGIKAHFERKDLNPVDKVILWEMKTWFPNQTLMKLDRLTMTHSIEGRSPYADYRLIEFFLKLPFDLFKGCMKGKNVIRSLYQKHAPFLPKKKVAFYLPIHNRFERKYLELVRDVLSKEAVKQLGWFQHDYVNSLLSIRKKSPLLVDKQIMTLTVLMIWLNSSKNDL